MWNIGVCADFRNIENLKKMREMGVDFFEFNFSMMAFTDMALVDECAAFIRENNIPVPSFNCILHGNLVAVGENPDHKRIGNFIESNMERALKFGAKNFVLGSGKVRSVPEGFSREKTLEQFESLVTDTLLPIFRRHDVYLSVEELRKEESNTFNSCREVMELVNRVNDDHLTLLVDYYHAMLGGDTCEEIASYGNKISHVHIASPSNERMAPLPGDGDDYGALFRALEKAGYASRNISMEGKFGDDMLDTVKRSLAYLRTF